MLLNNLPHYFPQFFFFRIIALQCYVSFCCTTAWFSNTCTCIPSLPSSRPPHPTPLGQRRAPGHRRAHIAPCAICSFPPAISFPCDSVSVSVLLPQFTLLSPPHHTCPHVHSLCLHLYSCPAGMVHLDHFSRFHIYALIYDICFYFSDLLYSVWQTLSSSTSLKMTQFHSFSWLSNIPHSPFFLKKDCIIFHISIVCSINPIYWIFRFFNVKKICTAFMIATFLDKTLKISKILFLDEIPSN